MKEKRDRFQAERTTNKPGPGESQGCKKFSMARHDVEKRKRKRIER